MKVLNFGSLNIDYTYSMPHIVKPQETITSKKLEVFCGGKGLNQSIAMAKAGLPVYHAGLVGEDGKCLWDACLANGINTSCIMTVPERTGNAIIQVDEDGQNCILLYPGANRMNSKIFVDEVLEGFGDGDVLVLQNEINLIDYLIEQAHEKGMLIVLNPSPFDEAVLKCDLNKVSYFFMNEIEGELLTGESEPEDILDVMQMKYPDSRVVLTLGEKGVWYADTVKRWYQGIYQVDVVDTTAAGDTFTGYFLKSILSGETGQTALQKASLAAAMAVSKKGASDSIPMADEVENKFKEVHP